MTSLLTASFPSRSIEEPQRESSERRGQRCPVDLALHMRVQEALRSSPYRRLHLISTDVRDRVATLRGRVPSFHLKQLAQCLLAGIEGLERIDNRLHVAD